MEETNVRQKIFWISDSLELPVLLAFALVHPPVSRSYLEFHLLQL